MSLVDYGLFALAFFGALAYGYLTGRAEGYRRGYRQAERDRREGNDE